MQFQLFARPVVGDNPVLGEEAAGLGSFQLINRFHRLDERIGTEEELQHRGIRGRGTRGRADLAIHVVRHQHGVGRLLHVAVLHHTSCRLVEQFQHFIGRDAAGIKPLVRHDFIDLGIVEETGEAIRNIAKVGNFLRDLFVGAAHGRGPAGVQRHTGNQSGSAGLLDGVAEGRAQRTYVVGDFLTDHISTREIARPVLDNLHGTNFVIHPVGVGVVSIADLGGNRQNRGILDVCVFGFKNLVEDFVKLAGQIKAHCCVFAGFSHGSKSGVEGERCAGEVDLKESEPSSGGLGEPPSTTSHGYRLVRYGSFAPAANMSPSKSGMLSNGEEPHSIANGDGFTGVDPEDAFGEDIQSLLVGITHPTISKDGGRSAGVDRSLSTLKGIGVRGNTEYVSNGNSHTSGEGIAPAGRIELNRSTVCDSGSSLVVVTPAHIGLKVSEATLKTSIHSDGIGALYTRRISNRGGGKGNSHDYLVAVRGLVQADVSRCL